MLEKSDSASLSNFEKTNVFYGEYNNSRNERINMGKVMQQMNALKSRFFFCYGFTFFFIFFSLPLNAESSVFVVFNPSSIRLFKALIIGPKGFVLSCYFYFNILTS
jgi:hypothetical protein